MSALAELEVALRQDRALDRLSQAYSHRAIRESSLGLLTGREAILAAAVAEQAREVEIETDLEDMIAYRLDGRWRGHRWVWREGANIVREVVVEEAERSQVAAPCHPPLGELRAGSGQYAASAEPPFPPRFPASAREPAIRLHWRWNGRALGRNPEPWLIEMLQLLPDATFTFEHAVVEGARVALLWRVMGNHSSGRRIRLIGSSLVEEFGAQTVVDTGAITAQLAAETIDYA